MARPVCTVDRFDTLSGARRDQLLRQMPGWDPKAGVPQFFIVGPSGQPEDWPLIDTLADAWRECHEFNSDLIDEDARSEARGLAMMGGL